MANVKIEIAEKFLDIILGIMMSAWNLSKRIIRGKSFSKNPPVEQIGTKEAEIDFVKKWGDTEYLINKPFRKVPDRYLIDMGQIFSLLPPLPATILDMGCGAGWTSEFLSQRGYEVTGVDLSPDMIDIARKHRRRGGMAQFIVGDYESCSFSKTYDAVLFYDALHHSLDETAALKCAYKALRHGGRLIIFEPGVGHGGSEDSVEAYTLYGVTEKEMPPSRTMPILSALGFKNARAIFPISSLLEVIETDSAWRRLIAIQSTEDRGVVIAEK